MVPVVDPMHSHFVGAGDQLDFYINVSIVDTILRILLFTPDVEDVLVELVLGLFEPMKCAENGARDVMTSYRVHIKNNNLFKLVIGTVSLGPNFSWQPTKLVALARSCHLII